MRGNTAPYAAVGGYPLPLGFNGRLAWIYRWFSGRPLNGHRYTDATGFKYGTMALDVSGHATPYQLLPGALRFLYFRLPVMLAPVAILATLLWPRIMYYVALVLALVATWLIDRWRKRSAFRRDVIEPLSAGVSAVLRSRRVAGQGHMVVSVPEDFRDNHEAKVTIRLPLDWTGADGDRTALSKIVMAKLSMDELNAVWTLHGARPSVTFVQPVRPPKEVDFAEGVELAKAVDMSALALGVGVANRTEAFDLGLDSPHMIVAGGAGAGKSEFIAYLAGQWLRRSQGLAILDAKFTSHMWARRVPGVLYASEAQELHEALVWFADELLRRARLVVMDPSAAATLVPLLVVLEEMTAASNRLRAYWKSIKGPEDPMMSPALTALADLASMGRELRMHVILSSQSVTSKVSGGPESRENFAGRALARATAKQWAMLAPQIKPAPIRRNAPGRWHLVVGDSLKEFQVPFMDLKGKETPDAEDRFIAWATAESTIPDVPAMMLAGGGGGGGFTENSSSEPPTPPGISLRLFAEEQGIELARLNRWRERRSDFPSWVALGPRGVQLFDRDHLKAYVRERLREPVE